MADYKHPAWLGKAMQTGGAVDKSPPNPGEVSDAESYKYLRNKGANELVNGAGKMVVGPAAGGASLGVLRGLKKVGRLGPIGTAAGALGSLLGAGVAAQGAKDVADSMDTHHEAQKFEPRKRGGRTKK